MIIYLYSRDPGLSMKELMVLSYINREGRAVVAVVSALRLLGQSDKSILIAPR